MESNISRILSNYGAKLLSICSIIIFTPVYINYLGIENYAIIGFYTILLGIISFADSGLSSAIIKEFSVDKDEDYKYSVFRNIEKFYITICILIFAIIFFSSDFIGSRWLKSETIEPQIISYYIKLIGAGISLQLLSSLYYGSLFGQGLQVYANTLQIVWNLCRSGLVILLFIFLDKTLEVFLVWQIVCNLLYIIILRYKSLSVLEKKKGSNLFKNENKLPPHILKYIGGMSIIAIISAFNIQIDKIVVSFNFTLEQLGLYNIASVFGQTPIIVSTPLVLFAFPIFAKLALDPKGEKDLLEVFKKIFTLVAIASVVLFVLLQLYIKEIILLWIGDRILQDIETIVKVSRLLLVGSFFMALQMPFFYLLLAKGKTKYTIVQGIVQVIIGIPLLYFSTINFGIYGVALPWFIINLGAFFYLNYIVTKFYLYQLDFKYSFTVIACVLTACSIIFIPIMLLYNYLHYHFLLFIFISLLGFLAVVILLISKFVKEEGLMMKIKSICKLPN